MKATHILSSALLSLCAGCLSDPGTLGGIGGSGTESGTGSSTDSTPTTGEGETTDDDSSGAAESGESTGAPLEPEVCGIAGGMQRRLTSTQLEHAVEDLFGVTVQVQFDDVTIPFESGEALSSADSIALSSVAAAVSEQFAVPACAGDEDTCGQDFLDSYVPLVLRGQVSVDAFAPIYGEVGEYEGGIRAVVGAMITHPAFTDLTPTGTLTDGVVALDANSVATRLALLTWNSVPDAALLGEGDALLDSQGVTAALGLMLADPRFSRAQADLFAAMTGLRTLPLIDRSNVYEGWSTGLAASMLEEQRRFVVDQVDDADATLWDLMSSHTSFVNAELAALYGADLQTPAPAGDGWGPVELDPSHRAGLLTQLGMISAGSYNTDPDLYRLPPARGAAVLSGFLCQTVPPGPPGIPGEPGRGSLDSRPEWEAFIAVPSCETCHEMMDPLGFALGDYDGVGRWDPRGDETNASHVDLDGEYADAVELGAVLAEDDDVHACMAERYYTFALRRGLGEEDQCAVDAYAEAFTDSGGNLRALVQAIATSDTFRQARQ
ncbi:MAG: DUF1585 domain-containing protein [Nannocystaceae bacterium]|nr:DUF1585 domain-containing protein [Nannocystaceae bacterium]